MHEWRDVLLYQQREFDSTQWCHTGRSAWGYLVECFRLRWESLALMVASLLFFSGAELLVGRLSRGAVRSLSREDRFRWANKCVQGVAVLLASFFLSA